MLGCTTVEGWYMGKIQSKPSGYLGGCHSTIDSSLHCSPACQMHCLASYEVWERNRYHSPAKREWQCRSHLCESDIQSAWCRKSAKYTDLTPWKKLSAMRSGRSLWWNWRRPLQGWAVDKCSWTGLATLITKKHAITYLSDTHPDFPFISWCFQSTNRALYRYCRRLLLLLHHAAVIGWTEVFKLELPKYKCLVTGNMLRRNLHAVITFPVSVKQVKHNLSKIVQAQQICSFLLLLPFFFLKIGWYLRGCPTVALNILPWLYCGHERDSLLFKTSYILLLWYLSKWYK